MKTTNTIFSQILKLFFGSLFVLLVACGGGSDSQKSDETEENTENSESSSSTDAEEAASEEESSDSESSNSNQASIDYKTLQKYLPKNIKGYEAEGNPSGQQMNTPGGSFSQAEQVFKKGDDRFTVVIADYHLANAQLNLISAAWNMQFEDDNSKAGSVSLKGGKIKGWEVFDKQQKNANLTLIVGNRFLVNLTADNQKNTEFVKSTAESMDLNALIKLGK